MTGHDFKPRQRQKAVLWLCVFSVAVSFFLVELCYSSWLRFPLSLGPGITAAQISPDKARNGGQTDRADVQDACNFTSDLWQGDWVHDSAGPQYTPATCHYIYKDQDCISYGKPFMDYLYWRWKPNDCDLPRFNAAAFLDSMQGKTMAFVGDSISRNQMESLECLLSQVDRSSFYTRHSQDYKVVWTRFPCSSFTLVNIWAPFLIKHEEQPDGFFKLHLDVLLESMTSVIPQFDYVVFSAGNWFFRPSIYIERGQVIGCSHCSSLNLPELEFEGIYRKALRTFFTGINSVPGYKGLSLWRTWPVDHFEGGTWSTGGSCPRRAPFSSQLSGFSNTSHHHILKMEMDEYEEAGLLLNTKWELLNTTFVSWLRPDGHPGPHRNFPPPKGAQVFEQNDCLHWCLPGPLDALNDLLYLKLKAVKLKPKQP